MKLGRLLKKKKRRLRARCRARVWVATLALISLGALAIVYRQCRDAPPAPSQSGGAPSNDRTIMPAPFQGLTD